MKETTYTVRCVQVTKYTHIELRMSIIYLVGYCKYCNTICYRTVITLIGSAMHVATPPLCPV